MRSVAREIVISHIGMTDRDQKFLGNLFRLGTNQFKGYRLVDEDKLDYARICFVNADSKASLGKWQALANRPAGIMVTQGGVELNGQVTLNRPLVLRKVIEAIEKAEVAVEPEETAALNALVVDDSPPIRKYMELTLPNLVDETIAIQYAESGEEAMEKAHMEAFDIVFLDIILPGVDGYEVCKYLKEIADPFVVMLTSNRSPFDRVRGAMSGCDTYITKPPDEKLLRNAFVKMGSRRDKRGAETFSEDAIRQV